MILLDTCTLSEIKKKMPNPGVIKAMLDLNSSQTFVSTISLGEILRGALLSRNVGKQRNLLDWLEHLEKEYEHRILNVSLETSKIWAQMSADKYKAGRHIDLADGLIAATCVEHSLALMTRNEKDFEHTGIKIINPWE